MDRKSASPPAVDLPKVSKWERTLGGRKFAYFFRINIPYVIIKSWVKGFKNSYSAPYPCGKWSIVKVVAQPELVEVYFNLILGLVFSCVHKLPRLATLENTTELVLVRCKALPAKQTSTTHTFLTYLRGRWSDFVKR